MSKIGKNNPHRGRLFVDWLKEEGIYEQVVAQVEREKRNGCASPPEELEASIARRKACSPGFERGFEKRCQKFKAKVSRKK